MRDKLTQVKLYAHYSLEKILIGWDMINPEGEIVNRYVDPEAMTFVYKNWPSFAVVPEKALGKHFKGQPKSVVEPTSSLPAEEFIEVENLFEAFKEASYRSSRLRASFLEEGPIKARFDPDLHRPIQFNTTGKIEFEYPFASREKFLRERALRECEELLIPAISDAIKVQANKEFPESIFRSPAYSKLNEGSIHEVTWRRHFIKLVFEQYGGFAAALLITDILQGSESYEETSTPSEIEFRWVPGTTIDGLSQDTVFYKKVLLDDLPTSI